MMPWSPVRPCPPRCPHGRLRRLLARELPHDLQLGTSMLRPWASASFVGARHVFPCAVGGGDAATWRLALQDRLGTIEWRLPGHIVADLIVDTDGGDGLRIEILTVED